MGPAFRLHRRAPLRVAVATAAGGPDGNGERCDVVPYGHVARLGDAVAFGFYLGLTAVVTLRAERPLLVEVTGHLRSRTRPATGES